MRTIETYQTSFPYFPITLVIVSPKKYHKLTSTAHHRVAPRNVRVINFFMGIAKIPAGIEIK